MHCQSEFNFDEQQENLDRVMSRIGQAIVRFCRLHRRFHAGELHAFVLQETGAAAPASADRTLRDLRKRGLIDYMVLNRRESLYQVIWIVGEERLA